MATEIHNNNNDDDALEQTELARRLRRMEWPPAPREVKERVLERLVAQSEKELGGNGSIPRERSDD